MSERPRTTVRAELLRLDRRCWLFAVHRYRLNTYGRRVFSVAGAPQFGTHSRISSGTRPSVQTVSDVCLKRICSLDTSAFSALGVLDDNHTIQIYLITYLLTYLLIHRKKSCRFFKNHRLMYFGHVIQMENGRFPHIGLLLNVHTYGHRTI